MELKETASEEHFQSELRTFAEFLTSNTAPLKKEKKKNAFQSEFALCSWCMKIHTSCSWHLL